MQSFVNKSLKQPEALIIKFRTKRSTILNGFGIR